MLQGIILLSDRARLEMAQLCRLPGVSLSLDTETDTHMGLGERAGDGTVMAVRCVIVIYWIVSFWQHHHITHRQWTDILAI